MTSTAVPVDHLTHVFGRLQRVLGPGPACEDTAVAVVTRFLTAAEPRWLGGRSDVERLDVLTVSALLAGRRS